MAPSSDSDPHPDHLIRPSPTRPPGPSGTRSTVRGRMTAGLAVTVLVLTTAACTGPSSTSGSAAAEPVTMAAARTAAGVEAAGAATMAAAPDPAGGGAARTDVADAGEAVSEATAVAAPGTAPPAVAVAEPGDARQIIRTADLGVRLEVPAQGSPDANASARESALSTAVAAARTAVTAAGGLVASSDGYGERTTLGLRIPVDAYDATLDRLVGLGAVDHRTESSQDVTTELVDVGSRIDSMEASVARVRALLAQATDVGQVVAIEGELARREADLESLQRQRAALSGQVALSTVTLTLTAVTTGAPPTLGSDEQGNGFVAGLTGGWSALLALLTGLGTAAGALLPFVPFVAAGGWLVWWWRRRRRTPGASPSLDHRADPGTAG